MNTISLKLPDRLLELLQEESRARRTTQSSLVRECLEKVLAARPPGGEATCYELARDLAMEYQVQVARAAETLDNKLLMPMTIFFFIPFLAAIFIPLMINIFNTF